MKYQSVKERKLEYLSLRSVARYMICARIPASRARSSDHHRQNRSLSIGRATDVARHVNCARIGTRRAAGVVHPVRCALIACQARPVTRSSASFSKPRHPPRFQPHAKRSMLSHSAPYSPGVPNLASCSQHGKPPHGRRGAAHRPSAHPPPRAPGQPAIRIISKLWQQPRHQRGVT